MNANSQKTSLEALARLEQGNERFVSDDLTHDLQDAKRRAALKDSQHPWAIVLSCADSRVIPELVFDAGIGELFVVRVAGNIANNSSLASIEYAVTNLNVNLIVVLGHEGCGAVNAALNDQDFGHNLNHLVAHLKGAVQPPFATEDPLTEAVERNARNMAEQLTARSPIVAGSDDLKILPAIYRLETGKVDYLN
ncbi:MAG: carbonic anhydrase [Planctomycetota bacterium]